MGWEDNLHQLGEMQLRFIPETVKLQLFHIFLHCALRDGGHWNGQ